MMEARTTFTGTFSRQIGHIMASMENFIRFYQDSAYARLHGEPDACDFAIGNPHEMPLAELTQAFQKWSVPENKDWFAYKMSEPESQAVVAETLRKRTGLPYEPEDICMTNGAFAALNVALKAILDPGDEVIYINPPWFFYVPLIVSHQGIAVRVDCRPDDFDLDLPAIERAITAGTRAIIVNSPNNPTGRIYPPATLQKLSALLERASQRNGRAIFLLSDESYNRIVFDGKDFHSPTEYYPHSFLIYTYGKTTLAPGQRIGYLALPPGMPNRAAMRQGLFVAQIVSSYSFPNALLQHALPDLEKTSIDIGRLQARRDRMVRALRELGYQLAKPEGTFYLLVRSPLPDDEAFINLLSEKMVLCLPGKTFDLPGYFRISLTANDEMIERALPGFAWAMRAVKGET
jgi:aspartate aminotransferase